MNANMLTNDFKKVYKYASGVALRTSGTIGTEHLLYGILCLGTNAASQLFMSITGLKVKDVEKYLRSDGKVHTQPPALTPRANQAVVDAIKIAISAGQPAADVQHLIIALLVQTDSMAVKIMLRHNINISAVMQVFTRMPYNQVVELLVDNPFAEFEGDIDDMNGDYRTKVSPMRSVKLPKELDALGIDLTASAEAGKLDPVIGRSNEIERIIQILSRRTKNNPVLIGEPGVGKSAIVEGLAQAIVENAVPEMLKGKRIFSLDMASVVAGTKYRGEFEEKLKNAVEVIKKAGNIILFIDELHTLVGTGSAEGNAMDAANIIKPLLARGELQTIGATTIDEYRKHIEKDAALERRFQPIMVDPPSVEDTIKILEGLREKYENHHQVRITDMAIKAASVLSDRYITDRYLPDKAIDLIDEAASRKRLIGFTAPAEVKKLEDSLKEIEKAIELCIVTEDFSKAESYKKEKEKVKEALNKAKGEWHKGIDNEEMVIDEEDIATIVASMTSIPVVKLTEKETDRLMKLEETIGRRVIGQDEAVSAVSRAIRRARAGLADPKRPIGSFIFLGPTGVGKTELSKALASAMFGDENLMIRIDMSEYMDKISTSKLIGSAPGYVGYDEGGQLTEKVRRKPYSVLLFDEIEKAHPDVFNILLQILEDGRLTDSHGRTVSFKNTIIIMTSNIGASEISRNTLGFGEYKRSYEKMRQTQLEALKQTMKPEFINRIDDIIIFRPLEKEDIDKIADVMLNSLTLRLKEQNINVKVTKPAKDYLVEKGFDREYGARPLRRTIQKLVEDRLSEEILTQNISIGDNVLVDMKDSELVFSSKKN
ncbi:MAG: ATP-dependent Clp protease ATP-binding subunit [Christensenellales bacterium]|jgi:ATP-dependent Clp protease ATP-binding subunit ClpC